MSKKRSNRKANYFLKLINTRKIVYVNDIKLIPGSFLADDIQVEQMKTLQYKQCSGKYEILNMTIIVIIKGNSVEVPGNYEVQKKVSQVEGVEGALEIEERMKLGKWIKNDHINLK